MLPPFHGHGRCRGPDVVVHPRLVEKNLLDSAVLKVGGALR